MNRQRVELKRAHELFDDMRKVTWDEKPVFFQLPIKNTLTSSLTLEEEVDIGQKCLPLGDRIER